MMNVMFVLFANRAFSNVIDGVNSKTVSLAPLACSKPPSLYLSNIIDLWLIAFTISCAVKGD